MADACTMAAGEGDSRGEWASPRVSFETSFDSNQPKLEPKLISALSETKRLFRLFRFYTETESFGVSIESKQTEVPPKQFKSLKIFNEKVVLVESLS